MRLLNNRQRVLLSFLAQEKREVPKPTLMHWLFLANRALHREAYEPKKYCYDFVLLPCGPYSFEAAWDLQKRLVPLLLQNEHTVGLHPLFQDKIHEQLSRLDKHIRAVVRTIWEGKVCSDLSASPAGLTDKKELLFSLEPGVIYTIGYEGRTIDGFLNLLLQNGVRGIADVRRCPYSHKYGFSYATLRALASKLDIEYHSLPELGIAPELRRHLKNPQEYVSLFQCYQKELVSKQSLLTPVIAMLQKQPTALLCFEANPAMCHRSYLAQYLSQLSGMCIQHL